MTTETDIRTKGLVDAADRILRELIRTPKFKETVIILLRAVDPPAARGLVRTLFWQDPGLLLSLLGTMPAFINVGSEALAEVAKQMNSMPPPLLRDILDRIVSGIDGEAAGEAAGGLVGMALSLDLQGEESRLAESLATLGRDFGRAYAAAAGQDALTGRLGSWMSRTAERVRDEGSATSALVQAAGRALQENPDFVEYVLRPLLEPALKPAGKTAGKGAAAKAGQDGEGGEA
jgi:hypothetical protein